ncbi:MAG: metallophosphatase [Bacteroidales bacterium]
MKRNKKKGMTYRLLLLTTTLFLSINTWAQLRIYHSNDTHSQLDTITYGPYVGMGGAALRYGYLYQEKAWKNNYDSLGLDSLENLDFLLLDAGDAVQGTPYFNLFEGRVETEVMNVLGYDATCLGNHEFDNGLEALKERIRLSRFPVLCANYETKATALSGLLRPYIILKRKGLKIGIIGLTINLDGMVSKDKIRGLTYQNPITMANLYADSLRNIYHCDLIICLSHLGYNTTENIDGSNDLKLAQESRNIDLIIGGHTHTFLEKAEVQQNLDNRSVFIVQSGALGAKIGKFIWNK